MAGKRKGAGRAGAAAVEAPEPDPVAGDTARWLSAKETAAILGVNEKAVPRVADAAPLRTKKTPGHPWTRYYRPDVERVARESVKTGLGSDRGAV
jgi:hypothetical protein